MTNDVLFQKIDQLYSVYTQLLLDICNIESPSRHKEGVDAVGSYIAKASEALGWRVECFPEDVAGDIYSITMNPDAKLPPITLSAHLDTVHSLGSFGTPPAHIDGDRLYGPGATDCKGGVAVAMLAMHALYACGFNSRPVKLILQTDEEVGSSISKRSTINRICHEARDSVAFLNLEGAPSATPAATITRKGILTLTFKIHGKAAHSAQCAKNGANAILEAAHKIIELEHFKDHQGLTCSCTVISGGTVSNVVPEYCEFKANVRFATPEQRDEICRFAEELAARVYVKGCKTEVDIPRGRVAMEYTERNQMLLDKINSILTENGLEPYEAAHSKGGSDAADVTVYGIPCLDSLGIYGAAIHSTGEFARLPSMSTAAKRIALIIRDF